MEILPDIELVDLALFVKKEKVLILGDFHMGLEEALHKQGFLLPRFQLKDITERLDRILERVKPETIVINGDLKHEFGSISNDEWKNTLFLLDHLVKYHVLLIRGNHDTLLDSIAKKRSLEVRQYVTLGGCYICHGHKIPDDEDFRKARTIIIGHEHPAITITDGIRAEKFKCFLSGNWHKKKLIVMPSFSLLQEGTDIKKEKLLSPFLDDISRFQVFAVGDKIYRFRRVAEISD